MKRIIAFILASLMMLFTLISCDEKKEKEIDLSSFIVAKTEHYEIDGAMYAFFLYDFVGQYAETLMYYGYDPTLRLSEQTSKCTVDEEKTWFEFFAEMADAQIDRYLSACEAAYDAGVELKEEELAEIKNYVAELEADAVKNGYKNLDELLSEYYIEGVTKETFEKCLLLQQLSYSYMNDYSTTFEPTDEDLTKYRDEHPEQFLMINVLQYSFSAEYAKGATEAEIEAAVAAAKAKAESFFAENKTVDDFKNGIVAQEQANGNTTESASVIISKHLYDAELYDAQAAAAEPYKQYYEWAYSSERKAGDTFLLEDKDSSEEKFYTVFCIVEPVYYYDYLTKDCRHILFFVDNSETDKEVLAQAKEEALEKANSVLAEFNSGNKTEDDFKALETRCLNDESAMEATFYYNVTRGYMVTEFENWIYGERTKGDCEIVETTYGYHVVYFVGDGLPAWKAEAKTSYVSEAMTDYQEDLIDKYKVTYDNEAVNRIP